MPWYHEYDDENADFYIAQLKNQFLKVEVVRPTYATIVTDTPDEGVHANDPNDMQYELYLKIIEKLKSESWGEWHDS